MASITLFIQTHSPWSWILIFSVLLSLVLMLGWKLKGKKKTTPDFAPLTQSLQKKSSFSEKLEALFGRSKIDASFFSQLEEALIEADVGVQTSQKLLEHVSTELKTNHKTASFNDLKLILKTEMLRILKKGNRPENIPGVGTRVILMVGINGVGKTTTIGKLAKKFIDQNQTVLLACADTFRAGAIRQLQIWAERTGADWLAQNEGADPGAVAFDAVKSGSAKNRDLVLIDTAGRLHNKVNLMMELQKVKRVVTKANPSAPHEVYLVIDSTTGQNGLNQAKEFHDALGLTGIILTKMDGTSKGGIVLAIADTLEIPIRYVGTGEKAEQLEEFNADRFVEFLV